MGTRHATKAIGRIAFGSVVEPRVNDTSGKTEYSIGWVASEDETQDILSIIELSLEEERKRNSYFPKSNEKLHFGFTQSMKKDESGEKVPDEGMLLFKFKRNAHRTLKTGEQTLNTPPHIYDATGRLVDSKTIGQIGAGSTGRVIFETYVYDMKAAKGVQLQLVGFQIEKIRQEEAIELPPIEGGWVAEQSEADALAQMLAGDA